MNKIYFTIMEDYEIPQLDIKSYKLHLIKKLELLNKISKEYGIKWNHFLDFGTVFLIPSLGAKFNKEWKGVKKRLFQILQKTLKEGHELHLHYHGVTDSLEKEFAFKYNENSCEFIPIKDLNDIYIKKLGFISYFSWKKQNFFVNKLRFSIKMMRKNFKIKYPLFFRPGIWDVGRNLKFYYEILSKCNLTSSSLDGSIFSYKTKGANIGNEIFYVKLDFKKLLEVLPTKLPFSSSYIAPTYSELYLRLATFFIKKSKFPIKSLIEMYHITHPNDQDDLRKIEKHFRFLINSGNFEPITLGKLVDIVKDFEIPIFSPDKIEKNSKKIFSKKLI